MLKQTIVFSFLLLSLLAAGQQKKQYGVGDKVNIEIDFYNTGGDSASVSIPHNRYTLAYQYKWQGKGSDTRDSARQIETIIERIKARYKTSDLRVVCYSLDEGKEYDAWLKNIEGNKPFAEKPGCAVEYYNSGKFKAVSKQLKKLFEKLVLVAPEGNVLLSSCAIGSFKVEEPLYEPERTVLKAKLMTETNGNYAPLPFTQVSLFGEKEDTLSSTKTDKYGDFELPVPDANITYKIRVSSNAKTTFENIVFATQAGSEVGRVAKNEKGVFEYKLMKADIYKLSGYEEKEDITFAFRKFREGNSSTLKVVEDIRYGLARFDIAPESEAVLMKIVGIMENNPKIKLEIISHTDAQGDDAANLQLSKKRSSAVFDYLVAKGIKATRLKAIGKGETAIRNRCRNGVDCSDKEQEYNRRTEFNFIKPE